MEFIKSSSVILPFLAFSGCWIALWRRGQDWRTSFIISATLWGVWVAATTELLSAASLLTRAAVAAMWLVASILAWSFALLPWRGHRVSPASDPQASTPATAPETPLLPTDRLLLAGLIAIVLL